MPRLTASEARAARLIIAAALAFFVLSNLVWYGFDELRRSNLELTRELADQKAAWVAQQSQIDALQAEIADLKQRWYGSPALWSPPPIPNTDFQFFDVGGHSQRELIASIEKAAICDTRKCLPDPAVPPGGTYWGLEGFQSQGAWSTPYCYSPKTMTALFRTFILLPRWSPPPDGGVKIPLVERWNALEKTIYTHGAGHVAIDVQYLAALNDQAHQLPSCQALFDFWANPTLFDKLSALQNEYHARLRADCRPEIGCMPPGWMDWS
jgi:hypothetical protein